MKYIKAGTLAYNLHFIKTDKFKRTNIKINFKSPLTKEGITYQNLLVSIISKSSKEYKKARQVGMRLEDLYNAEFRISNICLGTDLLFSCNASTLRDIYTEDDNEEKTVKFICEMLFNPNVQDGKFDTLNFNLAKQKLKEAIETKDEDPNRFAAIRFIENFYEDSIAKYTAPGYMEDLEATDEKKLYEYYLNMLKSSEIDIFICGDVDENKYEEWFKKYFLINTVKKNRPIPILKHNKIRNRTKIVKDQRELKQCILKVGVKFGDLSLYERQYISRLYTYILGGGADSLMFNIIREKHSLCYYCSASFQSLTSSITMIAGVNKENIKKTVNLIKDLMKQIETGKFDEDKIEKYKIVVTAARKEMLDDPDDLIGLYQTKEYLGIDIGDDFEDQLKKLTKKKVTDFAKKVKIDTIYTLEGDDSNE